MNSAPDKKLLAQQILELNDLRLVALIQEMVAYSLKMQQDQSFLREYNNAIDRALDDLHNGDVISHEEMKKEILSW